MDTKYNLSLSWAEINWLRNVVREKRDFYANAKHMNYTSETETSKVVAQKIEDTVMPCFNDEAYAH